jgi:hypothetical protein
MTREHADLLNRVGMGINFVSFWFAVPELIGEVRLKAWEKSLAGFLSYLPSALKKAAYRLSALVFLILIARLVENKLTRHMVIPALPQGWTVALAALFALSVLFQMVGPWWVSKLANDNDIRQTSFLVGAVLFTLAFALQFWATFQNAPTP